MPFLQKSRQRSGLYSLGRRSLVCGMACMSNLQSAIFTERFRVLEGCEDRIVHAGCLYRIERRRMTEGLRTPTGVPRPNLGRPISNQVYSEEGAADAI